MKAALLDFKTLNVPQEALKELNKLDINLEVFNTTHESETLERIKNCDIVLTNKVILNEALLSKATRLKYIGVLATGTNNIDIDYIKKNKIILKNVTRYSTESVAQHTITLMLNLATQQNRYIQSCQRGDWSKSEVFCRLDLPIFELKGKTLGIIGFGNIGARVNELAKCFGMNTLIAESFIETSTNRTPLKELIKKSDFITLHCPLCERTKNLVNEDFLNQMKPSSFLINTSRGGVVNESNLLGALENNKIQGAALDVLSEEPPSLGNELYNYKGNNLFITPHNAWASAEARKKLISITAENLKFFLKETLKS